MAVNDAVLNRRGLRCWRNAVGSQMLLVTKTLLKAKCYWYPIPIGSQLPLEVDCYWHPIAIGSQNAVSSEKLFGKRKNLL